MKGIAAAGGRVVQIMSTAAGQRKAETELKDEGDQVGSAEDLCDTRVTVARSPKRAGKMGGWG